MISTDLHAHTNFCDGKDSPEQMIISAVEKGLKKIGLVIHSYIDFASEGGCKSIETETAFRLEMQRLKEKYADKITVLCGIEMDYYSKHVPKGFDYVIGSVHFFKAGGKYYPIDYDFEKLKFAVEDGFNGDIYSAVEDYFNNVSKVVEKHNADVIGHVDLITKFNCKNPYIDVTNERYVNAWKRAVDKLLPYGKPFEVNTGAISRGYKKEPYPALDILNYIKEKGGKFVLSSDSHNAKNLAYQFVEWQKLL